MGNLTFVMVICTPMSIIKILSKGILFLFLVILFKTFVKRQLSYQESYLFHSSCPCKRTRYFPDVSSNYSLQKSEKFFVSSTCDRYTSSLGTVQNVLSYAYYIDPYST